MVLYFYIPPPIWSVKKKIRSVAKAPSNLNLIRHINLQSTATIHHLPPSLLLPEKHRVSFFQNLVRCYPAASLDVVGRSRSTFFLTSLDVLVRDRGRFPYDIERGFLTRSPDVFY